MSKIKAIIFDLDDTLLWDERSVSEAFQATCRYAASRYDIDPERLEEEVRKHARELYATYDSYEFTLDIGINPFEGLWGDFNDTVDERFSLLKKVVPGYRRDAWTRGLKELGVDDPRLGEKLAERFPQERSSRPIVYEETYEVLDKLKEKYRLFLLTNGSPELQGIKLAGVPKLPTYFDHIVVSGEFGEGKPSPNIFRHVMELADIRPEEGVMVGDKLSTDIRGALGVGMHSVWINRNQMPASPDVRPDFEIENLRGLFDVLHKLNGQVHA